MRAFVITLKGHAYSEACADRCIKSAKGIEVERFEAVGPERSESVMKDLDLSWTWGNGWKNLKHHPYGGGLPARIGCAMSHYLLWRKCVDIAEPILILEHDAVFIRDFVAFDFRGICQINDPAGATKRGQWWSEHMRARGTTGVHDKTRVLPDDVPDGLAGNSAYVIKPHAARQLVDAYHTIGVWPNDATMCRQFFDLQEYFPFVTRVEQTVSTTSR